MCRILMTLLLAIALAWSAESHAQEGQEELTIDEQVVLLRKAKAGDTQAQVYLGSYYSQGDEEQGFVWFKRAAMQGEAEAQLYLGLMYERGEGVAQNLELARQWYRRAALQGESLAQHALAMLYYHGKGGEQDYVQARKWLEAARAQKMTGGDEVLAQLYEHGLGGYKNLPRARYLYERMCRESNFEACHHFRRLTQ